MPKGPRPAFLATAVCARLGRGRARWEECLGREEEQTPSLQDGEGQSVFQNATEGRCGCTRGVSRDSGWGRGWRRDRISATLQTLIFGLRELGFQQGRDMSNHTGRREAIRLEGSQEGHTHTHPDTLIRAYTHTHLLSHTQPPQHRHAHAQPPAALKTGVRLS